MGPSFASLGVVRGGTEPTLAIAVRGLTVTAVPGEPVAFVGPTLITVAHPGGLEEGALFAWSRRLELGGG